MSLHTVMKDFLDITKSVMISSPAGSGKTEKLARRYISLLKAGSEVERILAITFTDKAAAEMKERILNILKTEDTDIFERVREKVPRMRISTIHSFCLKLLKRFSIDLGIDPSLEVLDSFNEGILWSEAIYETLLEESKTGHGIFTEILKREGIKGWNKLYSIFKEIHGKRPAIELGLKNGIIINDSDTQDDKHDHFKQIISVYSRCLDRYRKKKLERHFIDYNDLELMAYEAITKNPEWQNVLFSFDEHTDHILIDEFQDTSTLQWKIIDKLTEEWRSGMGAKRESGIKPTIFLVGDDKQSIYSFRGANVNIFREAKEKLAEWLNEEYHFIEVEENYRSLPSIVNFVNSLFKIIMPPDLIERPGMVKYSPFRAERNGDGDVQLCIIESTGNIRDDRKREALYVADKIIESIHGAEIYEGKEKRKARYGDMAVLLRSRTHLSTFEDALRQHDIPFVAVKGIGFYQTPEVAILRDILFFLIDNKDDYSLFNILRSPLFGLGYEEILDIILKEPLREMDGFLFSLLKLASEDKSTMGVEKLRAIISRLDRWLEIGKKVPYSILLEEILNETEGWKYFSEPQRHRNIKKFLRLLETFESSSMTGLEIREKLIRASNNSDEPKANVNSEDLDAVRIMTIHAAKGLQFPIVFLPCLDEEERMSNRIVLEESGDKLIVAFEDDSELRKENPIFMREKEKSQEEEKRLFYVAVTRAMDHLHMSGIIKDKDKIKGRLAYITDAFMIDLSNKNNRADLPLRIEFLSKDQKISPLKKATPSLIMPGLLQKESGIVHTEPLDYQPSIIWSDVTEEIDYIRKKHGDNWVILGRIFHSLFEGLSRSLIGIDNIEAKIDTLIKQETTTRDTIRIMKTLIREDIEKLKDSGLLEEIVMPRDNSFAELPFILQRGNKIYRGRIDRVIIEKGIARIYDYKTYPINEKEIPELKEKYSFQLQLYSEAVERIFSVKTEGYLFFTHELRLVRI
ncbi:MAG: UvrD-helicase domain-containing protein [Thermodesulfovibrionales bacterium]